jgi:signal transduction histidine kinase
MSIKRWKDTLVSFLLNISIQQKILGLVFTLISIIGIAGIIEIRLSVQAALSTQLDARVEAIGQDVAARSVDLYLTNDIYLLQGLVSNTVKNNSDVKYAFILDGHNHVIVQSFRTGRVSEDLIRVNSVSSDGSMHLQKINTDIGLIRDVAVPIVRGIGGTVRIGLGEDSLNYSLSTITKQFLLVIFIVFLFSVLVALVLTKFVATPIKRLVFLTKEVTRGNLTVRMESYANDEIGNLASAFNYMLDHLRKTNVERDLFNKEILLRNRELSLLNELTGQVQSLESMRLMIRRFLQQLVEGLRLRASVIQIQFLDEDPEEYLYFINKNKECQYNVHHLPCNCVIEGNANHSFTIKLGEQTIGRFQICLDRELDQQSLKIIESLTNQLAISIQNLRLWIEVKKKEKIRVQLLDKIIIAQEDERKRIARELHDETSQSLTSILIGLRVLEEKHNEREKQREIQHLRDLMQQTLHEVHEMAWQLRPSVLDTFGLKVALQRYIDNYKNKYSLDVDLYVVGDDDLRLKSEIEISIYRIAQEALTNVARYAQAKNISVILERQPSQLNMIVEDDGIGFEVQRILNNEPNEGNLGILGMQERVSLLGGTFVIESVVDKGTSIFVRIPL